MKPSLRFPSAPQSGARWQFYAFALLLCMGCANDVVLGEHVTTTGTNGSSTSTAAAATTEHSEASSTSTMGSSTRCPFPPFPDGGKPNNDDRRDEDDWRRDGGFDFDDCRFLDAGPRPPLNPDHQMDNDDEFETKPNQVGPRPGESSPSYPSAPFDNSTSTAPAGSDAFSD